VSVSPLLPASCLKPSVWTRSVSRGAKSARVCACLRVSAKCLPSVCQVCACLRVSAKCLPGVTTGRKNKEWCLPGGVYYRIRSKCPSVSIISGVSESVVEKCSRLRCSHSKSLRSCCLSLHHLRREVNPPWRSALACAADTAAHTHKACAPAASVSTISGVR